MKVHGTAFEGWPACPASPYFLLEYDLQNEHQAALKNFSGSLSTYYDIYNRDDEKVFLELFLKENPASTKNAFDLSMHSQQLASYICVCVCVCSPR